MFKKPALIILAALLLAGALYVLPAKTTYAAPKTTPNSPSKTTTGSEACDPAAGSTFLGLPTWYEYLPGKTTDEGGCVPQISCTPTSGQNCVNQPDVDPMALLLIGLAIIEIMLRIAGVIALGMVIFGGFKYILSQGNPESTKGARQTLINAFVGLTITILAAVSVNFIAKLLK